MLGMVLSWHYSQVGEYFNIQYIYSMLFNKIIMHACRYWPENDEEAKSEAAGISLEALHQLASQRAEARRKSKCKVAVYSQLAIYMWYQ